MHHNKVVLDSGVFAKVFTDEDDREEVLSLIRHLVNSEIDIFCPDIFLYEVLSVAAKNGVSLENALTMIRSFEKTYLRISPLDENQLHSAIKMAETGHPKSGYPSIYDSAYHVLAMFYDGVFITADKKHYDKTVSSGNICLLKDWKSAFSNNK